MSNILVAVDEQNLHITEAPKIAAQGVNENYLVFSFDPTWTGFGKVALFYREEDEETVYESAIDENGYAVIPYEVTAADGKICFGVAGVKENIVYTSEILTYKIVKGIYTAGSESQPPSPGIYAQMLAAIGSVQTALNNESTIRAAELRNESTIRATADTVLGGRIDNLIVNGNLKNQVLTVLTQTVKCTEYETYSYAEASFKVSDYPVLGGDHTILSLYFKVDIGMGYIRSADIDRFYFQNGAYTVKVEDDEKVLMHNLDTVIFTFIVMSPAQEDAELTDIRVGADGTTYQTAGEAVRAQAFRGTDQTLSISGEAADAKAVGDEIGDLKEDLDDITEELFSVSDNLFDFDSIVENAVPGSIGSSPDTTITLNGWKTSNYIPVDAGQQYALIINGKITTGMVFRVACYANGVETYKSSIQESNPYTIPNGVDHIRFFSNSASLFSTRTATSFKKYTADLNLAWTPYGLLAKFATKDVVQEYGVYVDGTNYYHFVKFGEQTLIRLFKQEGPNNLFQFSALYTGNVTKDGVSIGQTIATNGTDTVGPISIMRQGIDSGGKWSGGWHTVTINGTAYPTAEQQNLDIKVNGESIVGVDGLHYGECVATVVNKLYFPQTITGSDLSTATQAIEETVQYILNKKMTARVSHKYVADTRVILYYGMQAVRVGFNNILLPNNETAFAFADMTSNINLDKPEDLMQMSNNDWNYDLIVKPFGLAKYTHNSGAGPTKYGYLPTATRKVYWALMEGTYDYTFITSGKVLAWEGIWDIYPN